MPINRPDKVMDVRPGSLDVTSMRYHELWLQRWLYAHFYVREGYPVPVVFSTPMDAFSLFSKLWADESNPFAYLFGLKDAQGTPLYEPYPSPVRYPLISVSRQGIKLRSYQNFSTHRWRHLNWPTVSDTQAVPGKVQVGNDLTKCQLGEVMVSRMPMAFDYRFQIDHFCLRPDTQAYFIEKLLNQFWRTGGGILQTWMDIEYPGWGHQYIRIYAEGDIDNRPPDETANQDKHVEFRTSFTLVIEGFDIDVAYKTFPALWKLVATSARIDDLDRLLLPSFTTDLRVNGTNQVLDSRVDIPPSGTCQSSIRYNDYIESGSQHIYAGMTLGGGTVTYASYGTGTNAMAQYVATGSVVSAEADVFGTYLMTVFIKHGTFSGTASSTTTTFGTYESAIVGAVAGPDQFAMTVSTVGTSLLMVWGTDAGTDAWASVSSSVFGTYQLA